MNIGIDIGILEIYHVNPFHMSIALMTRQKSEDTIMTTMICLLLHCWPGLPGVLCCCPVWLAALEWWLGSLLILLSPIFDDYHVRFEVPKAAPSQTGRQGGDPRLQRLFPVEPKAPDGQTVQQYKILGMNLSRRALLKALAGLAITGGGVGLAAYIIAHESRPSCGSNGFSWENILTYSNHSNFVFAVAWSRDNMTIASGGEDHTVQIWDAIS